MSMTEGEELNYDTAPPEESSNRTFLIAAGILGGIVLLSIACLAGYALLILPGQKVASIATNDVQATNNAQVQSALTSTMQAQLQPTATLTFTPMPTSVLAQATATIQPLQPLATKTPDPVTATVAVALTQAQAAQLTVVVQPTASAMPGTGIADEYGLPGLVAMGLAFMIVILLARRLRSLPVSNK
jgi:hypothetical protein